MFLMLINVGGRLAEPEGGVKQSISLEYLRSHKMTKSKWMSLPLSSFTQVQTISLRRFVCIHQGCQTDASWQNSTHPIAGKWAPIMLWLKS